MLLGLRTTIYKVPDLDKAKAWFSDVFGIAPYFDQPFYVGYNVGGYELGLDPDKSRKVVVGNNNITYWGVADLRTLVAALKVKEITIVEDVQNVGGEILVATIADPFGNNIGLIENPEFKLPV
ncbi:MAG: VOC family protein [Bacteroidota bacterium]